MARTWWRYRCIPFFVTSEFQNNIRIVFISFPPLVGHTTLVTLCGFAYGMKGFYISASSSVIGSALAFLTLRFLFRHRLRHWSTQNEKWQALEAVVVSIHQYRCKFPIILIFRSGSQGLAPNHFNSHIALPSMGLLEFFVRGWGFTISYVSFD